MKRIRIALDDGKANYFPGETLSGTVEWGLPEKPERLQIILYWYTAGSGTQDMQIVASLDYQTTAQNDNAEFEFVLPEAPYSFSGTHISLCWAVEAVAWPVGEKDQAEFVMSHTGDEIYLKEIPQPSPLSFLKRLIGNAPKR